MHQDTSVCILMDAFSSTLNIDLRIYGDNILCFYIQTYDEAQFDLVQDASIIDWHWTVERLETQALESAKRLL